PTLGHSRDREEAPDLLPIEGVDAEDVADGEIVVGALDDLNLIARPHVALDKDAQQGTGAQGLSETAREELVVHPHAQPPAGHPRLGALQYGGPDRPALPDEGIVHRNALRREVLAQLPVLERPADLLRPPAEIFHGIRIDRLVGAAVGTAIRLVVAGQVDSAGGDPAGRRRFPDGAPGGATVVFELARQTDGDGEHLASPPDHTPSRWLPG